MKKILVALLALASTAFAAEPLTYDAAITKAKEINKPVIAVFSGSDWCPPCIALEKNILSSDEFLAAAKADKFVFLFVDFPRKKAISNQEKVTNQALASKFNIEGFPTILLLNAEGKELAKEVGLAWKSPKAFLDWVEKRSK